METPENKSPQAGSGGKSPWERPTVTLAGTISLLVRGGSAQGKGGDSHDGDTGNFQAKRLP